jgi:hypothetical protein
MISPDIFRGLPVHASIFPENVGDANQENHSSPTDFQ